MPPDRHAIRFEPSGRRIDVEAGTTLLAAARAAGLPVASACGADAICGRCGLEILEGAERVAPETAEQKNVKQRNRIDGHLRLACQLEVRGDLVVTAPYW